jgi:hypothetical protein
VYCPVSGVLFAVTETSAKIDTAAGPIYACCPGCAEYFAHHRDRVITTRNIDLSPRS